MGMRMRIWHTDNRHRDLPHRLLQGARPGRGQQRTRPRHISPSGSFKPSWRCKEAGTMLLIVTPSGAPYTVHETFANDQELEDSMAQAGRTHRRSPRQRATREMIWRGGRRRVIEGLPRRRLAFCRGNRWNVCDCGSLLALFTTYDSMLRNVIDHVESVVQETNLHYFPHAGMRLSVDANQSTLVASAHVHDITVGSISSVDVLHSCFATVPQELQRYSYETASISMVLR